jgi:hypothetical protein
MAEAVRLIRLLVVPTTPRISDGITLKNDDSLVCIAGWRPEAICWGR